MKLNSLVFCLLLFSCSNNTSNIKIIPKNKFVQILKDIHLAEADYEMNKSKGEIKAQENLSSSYHAIFSSYDITNSLFDNTMSYYSNNPEQLEEIYYLTLQMISDEKDSQYD